MDSKKGGKVWYNRSIVLKRKSQASCFLVDLIGPGDRPTTVRRKGLASEKGKIIASRQNLVRKLLSSENPSGRNEIFCRWELRFFENCRERMVCELPGFGWGARFLQGSS